MDRSVNPKTHPHGPSSSFSPLDINTIAWCHLLPPTAHHHPLPIIAGHRHLPRYHVMKPPEPPITIIAASVLAITATPELWPSSPFPSPARDVDTIAPSVWPPSHHQLPHFHHHSRPPSTPLCHHRRSLHHKQLKRAMMGWNLCCRRFLHIITTTSSPPPPHHHHHDPSWPLGPSSEGCSMGEFLVVAIIKHPWVTQVCIHAAYGNCIMVYEMPIGLWCSLVLVNGCEAIHQEIGWLGGLVKWFATNPTWFGTKS